MHDWKRQRKSWLTIDWRPTRPERNMTRRSLSLLLLLITLSQPTIFALAQRNTASSARLSEEERWILRQLNSKNPTELRDAAAQDEVTRLRKALADALALLDKKESDAKAAQALIEKLEAELKAANETLAASKSETQAANKVIAAADQALTAQSKALEMTERANERLLMLADRYEARVATLEKRVDSANKRGFWGTVGGIIGGVLIGRRF